MTLVTAITSTDLPITTLNSVVTVTFPANFDSKIGIVLTERRTHLGRHIGVSLAVLR